MDIIETKPAAFVAEFRRVMAERRAHKRGTPDHTYRTRAARKLLWIMRGVPVARWAA